jgi:hypothetical protein
MNKHEQDLAQEVNEALTQRLNDAYKADSLKETLHAASLILLDLAHSLRTIALVSLDNAAQARLDLNALLNEGLAPIGPVSSTILQKIEQARATLDEAGHAAIFGACVGAPPAGPHPGLSLACHCGMPLIEHESDTGPCAISGCERFTAV